jgi:hypothetical protein
MCKLPVRLIARTLRCMARTPFFLQGNSISRARDARRNSGWNRISDDCVELMPMLAVAKCRTDGYPAVRISARLACPGRAFFESAGVLSRSLNIELHRLLRIPVAKNFSKLDYHLSN